MEVRFMVSLHSDLRSKIKREARKNEVTMNEFIVTVLEQYIAIQGAKHGKNTQGDRG